LSVPVRKYDGYGLYLLESNSAGVPFVSPATGAFPEIVARTTGGITYSPDSVTELAASLRQLLNDKEKLDRLGRQGKEKVLSELSLEKMSEGLSKVYNQVRQK